MPHTTRHTITEGTAICGVVILDEVRRLWAHARQIQSSLDAPIPAELPAISVKRYTGDRWRMRSTGRAWACPGKPARLHISAGDECRQETILGVLAHEVAHHMAWDTGHRAPYWEALERLVFGAYLAQPRHELHGNRFENQSAVEFCIGEAATVERSAGGCLDLTRQPPEDGPRWPPSPRVSWRRCR